MGATKGALQTTWRPVEWGRVIGVRGSLSVGEEEGSEGEGGTGEWTEYMLSQG